MPKRPGEVFAFRLLDRLQHGDQKDLADKSGVSVASFSKWRSWAKAARAGKRPPKSARYPNPSLTEVEQIAAVLKVAPAHLISELVGPDGRAAVSEAVAADLDRLRELDRRLQAIQEFSTGKK